MQVIDELLIEWCGDFDVVIDAGEIGVVIRGHSDPSPLTREDAERIVAFLQQHFKLEK